MAKKNRIDSPKAALADAKPSRLADYFWANVIFFAFLFILAFIVRKSCEAPGDDPAVRKVLDDAFSYLMLLFGGGFLLVTLFDAAYGFFAERSDEGEGVSGDSQA